MEKIGQAASGMLTRITAGEDSHPSRSVALRRPADAGSLSVYHDHECDIDLPARLFSAWHPAGGQRAIIRALTNDERGKLTARVELLTSAIAGYTETEQPSVEAEIAAMLNGFRSMRQRGDEVTATVQIIARVLRDFPPWAIAKGCMSIARQEAGLDPRFPPNDNQIYAVVDEIVKPYRRRLLRSQALLAAPVEATEARPTREQVEAMLGRKIPEARPGRPPVEDNQDRGDGRHAERVMADLAARKARREQDTAA